MEQAIQLLASLFATLLIMIAHEIPKTLVYNVQLQRKIPMSRVIYLPQYIDPIGVLFCTFSLAGFSKPFRYEIKEKKKATYIGLIGLLSLLLCMIGAYLMYRYFYTGIKIDQALNDMSMSNRFSYYFICYSLLISFSMFIVNLFPVSAFDMGLIIAGRSLQSFIHIIRMDTIMKITLFIVLYTQAIPIMGIRFINFLLSL